MAESTVDPTVDYVDLQCACVGQDLTRSDETILVRGQASKIVIAFGLSSEWSDMEIYARFRKKKSSTIYDCALSSDYEVEVPHEVTDSTGTFEMALRAETDDDRVLTSDIVEYTVVDTIIGNGTDGGESTETIYTKLKEAATTANTAAATANAATAKANTATAAAEEATTAANEAAEIALAAASVQFATDLECATVVDELLGDESEYIRLATDLECANVVDEALGDE